MGQPPWENLKLTDTLQVKQTDWLTDLDWTTLARLYLPIIGSQSYALFHGLYQLLPTKQFKSAVIRHTDITDTFVWSARTYVTARAHLEGIGLLGVYHRKDAYQDPQWLYELSAPVTPQVFFEDAVLSTLLYREVGEKRFKQLRDSFSVSWPSASHDDWQAQTYSFRDVYRFSPEEADAMPDLSNGQSFILGTAQKEPNAPIVIGDQFDVWLYKQTLMQRHIPERALTDKVLELATVLHDLYGYDEMDLARLTYRAMDFNRQQIDTDKLQQKAYDSLPSKKNQATTAALQSNTNDPKILEKLTVDQRELAKEAREYSVIDFVSYLKESRNGYLTKSERQILTDMVARNGLSSAVINVMAYYYLIEMDKPTLIQNTMERTENDWLKQNINTPEAALYYLAQRNERQSQKKRRYHKNNNYKEMIPDWMKDDQSTTKKADKRLKDRSDEIQRLLNKDKGER